MRVVSVNVGKPRTMTWDGEPVQTGIYKTAVAGRRTVGWTNIDGDGQADLAVHGGVHQAVYGYPWEHYAYWRTVMPEIVLEPGSFGENLTLEGLTEDTVHIGDRLRIGTAELIVTIPRQPCYKLANKLGRPEVVREMLESGTSGFYFAVAAPGEVAAGDAVEVVSRDPQEVTIADVNRMYIGKTSDVDLFRRVLLVDAMPERWRKRFQARLDELTA